MDMYGQPAQDIFRIDDLLDFSNDDLFSPNPAAADSSHCSLPANDSSASATAAHYCNSAAANFISSSCDFAVPSDDAAELEWLSRFVDDSFSDFPASDFPPRAPSFRQEPPFHGRSRSKRTRAVASAPSANSPWISPLDIPAANSGKSKSGGGGNVARQKEASPAAGEQSAGGGGGGRRCSHCASEKTPQWRTGPLGPKTLCNACGVRYKSGRLVPEYRPAASPTFVLTQHSNSHRKVMELRRQKEILRQDAPPQTQLQPQSQRQTPIQLYHHQNFEVC